MVLDHCRQNLLTILRIGLGWSLPLLVTLLKVIHLAVEKQQLVQILSIISEIKYEEFSLIFAGGTALSKAHKLIYRMSEDIDFKLNLYNELQSRKSLFKFKKFIITKLESSKLQISIKKIRAQNDNHFFAFEIDYPSYFDHNISLRNHILLEFSAKKIKSY